MAVLTTARLPVRLTPLVGRDARTRRGDQCPGRQPHCSRSPGPGGTGKTAAGAGRRGRGGGRRPDVAWVELARPGATRPSPPDGGRQARHTRDARRGPGRRHRRAPGRATTSATRPPLLVVLDNCEHLAAAVAGLAESLLGRVPVRCASSPPAASHSASRGSAPGRCRRCGPVHATRLFAESGPAGRAVLPVTDANRQAVAQVCARPDGLPLAIELAAARMRVLSARQLAERLDDVFGVLTGGARTAPPRHQALRATLDWSYELLTGPERTVFRRLAVFCDGFTLAAAERVAASAVHPGRARCSTCWPGSPTSPCCTSTGRRRALPPAGHIRDYAAGGSPRRRARPGAAGAPVVLHRVRRGDRADGRAAREAAGRGGAQPGRLRR